MPTLAQSYILTSKGSYMRPVVIDNTQNSNNLSNYQVQVTLNTANLISTGKMRSDCGDISFYDSNWATKLNYWIEGPCNSPSTLIWVKVPSIPASSTKTIYLYYGNSFLTSMSNPLTTFLFYDDFTTFRSTNATWSYLYTTSFNNKNVMYIATGNNETILNLPSSLSQLGIEFRYYIVSLGPYGPRASIRFISTGANTDYAIVNEIGSYYHNYYYLRYNDGSNFNVLTSNGNSYSTGVWYRNYLYRDSTVGKLIGLIGASSQMSATHTTLSSFNSVGLGTWDSGNKYYIDFIAVRNYAYPEPTTSIGSEIYIGPGKYIDSM
jgi:hypothetical protein